MFPKWTTEEDNLLRSGLRFAQLERQLPGRTRQAMTSRRQLLGIAKPATPCWTKTEDRRLIKYRREPLAKLAKRFKNRTRGAIRTRRKNLGCVGGEHKGNAWLGSEIKQLKLLYPTVSREELITALPRHPWLSIQQTAVNTGLHRAVRPTMSRGDLRDQIRKRAKEDGIPLDKLASQTDVPLYFLRKRPEPENYNRIARAVEFFGGRLMIDWQDE